MLRCQDARLPILPPSSTCLLMFDIDSWFRSIDYNSLLNVVSHGSAAPPNTVNYSAKHLRIMYSGAHMARRFITPACLSPADYLGRQNIHYCQKCFCLVFTFSFCWTYFPWKLGTQKLKSLVVIFFCSDSFSTNKFYSTDFSKFRKSVLLDWD